MAPATPELPGSVVTLRPAVEDDIGALAAIRATPEVRARWRDEDDTPESIADPNGGFFAILLEGAVVGAIQYSAEDDPDYRHAGIDIYLDPAVHGHGVGTDAVRTLAVHLVDELGFHRLVIDPAADNAAAIRCYTKVGFQPVGIMRRYERDTTGEGWHDGLLMDLLAEELVR
jgi:aminoglycoside 6'-N-acetyltransferase